MLALENKEVEFSKVANYLLGKFKKAVSAVLIYRVVSELLQIKVLEIESITEDSLFIFFRVELANLKKDLV